MGKHAPLYSLILSLWIKIFGFSIVSVRSLNIVFVSAATLIITGVIRREKIGILAALLLCGFASVVLFDYGVALNYRSGRYDGLGILLVTIAAWGASHRGRLGMIALSLACLVMPAAGVQVVVCAGIAFSIALLVFRVAALPAVAVGSWKSRPGNGAYACDAAIQ